MLCIHVAYAAQDGRAELSETPILWNGVEVITNDFDSVDRIREVAALRPGTVLRMSDPNLQAVCDAVRRELPASRIACSPVASATAGGRPKAWYLIEVDIKEHEALSCTSDVGLSEDLSSLNQAWLEAVTQTMFQGVVAPERVNDRKYLDYDNAELSSLAGKLHATTKGRAGELESAARSCDPRQRAASFYLMSFAGDPQRFIQLAGSRINDPDGEAANAATRFLAVFADFVSARDVPGLAAEACRSVQEGGFTARNKSLMLLNAWRKEGRVHLKQLAPACQQQIRNIARTSLAEQVALPARELASD
jgi:hypothetical protein